MFDSLKKMINGFGLPEYGKKSKEWESDHEKLKKQVGVILNDYRENKKDKVKKDLQNFKETLMAHILDEELAFMNMQKDNIVVKEVSDELDTFRGTFKGIKDALNDFFTIYLDPQKEIDEEFKSQLEGIAEVLVNRIHYEENNLYELLYKKTSIVKKL